MNEQSELELWLLERAGDKTPASWALCEPEKLREAAAAIAELRGACEGWRDWLEYLDARDHPDDPLAIGRHEVHGDRIEANRKALAGLARGGAKGGDDGGVEA